MLLVLLGGCPIDPPPVRLDCDYYPDLDTTICGKPPFWWVEVSGEWSR